MNIRTTSYLIEANKLKIKVVTAQPEHINGILAATRLGYGMTIDDDCQECFLRDHLHRHQAVFPEGQFVAIRQDQVVGYAITMRTSHTPTDTPLTWIEAIGDLGLKNHDPKGEWLYGVDFAVLPEFRRRGVGTMLYHARFKLVRQLNLRGFFAGGLLRGYRKYQRTMTLREYARKVRSGEIFDPTVSMQINRGFEPGPVIEGYIEAPPAEDNAMLIVWENQPSQNSEERKQDAQNSGIAD